MDSPVWELTSFSLRNSTRIVYYYFKKDLLLILFTVCVLSDAGVESSAAEVTGGQTWAPELTSGLAEGVTLRTAERLSLCLRQGLAI